MRDDAQRLVTGPGGQVGAASDSCAVDFIPYVDASDQSLPGPATGNATATQTPTSEHLPTPSARPASKPQTRRRVPSRASADGPAASPIAKVLT
jgi:hypothetical protein